MTNGIIHKNNIPPENPAGNQANIDAEIPLVGNITNAIPIKIIDIINNKNNAFINPKISISVIIYYKEII